MKKGTQTMTASPELKRYHPSEFGDGMIPSPKGEWVSLSDVEAYTQAAIAAAMMGRWRDPSEYADYVDKNDDELVQVLCEVVPDEDGDYISIGDHAVGDRFVSVGLRVIDERDDWPWDVAGYDMYHDRFTQARGFRVIGWMPLSPVNPSIPTDAMAALDAMKAQVRDDVLEQAAQEIEAVTDWDYATQNDVAAAIRTMKGGA